MFSPPTTQGTGSLPDPLLSSPTSSSTFYLLPSTLVPYLISLLDCKLPKAETFLIRLYLGTQQCVACEMCSITGYRTEIKSMEQIQCLGKQIDQFP